MEYIFDDIEICECIGTFEDEYVYDEDDDYVGDSLDDYYIYKQTRVIKVQGHSWTSEGRPTEDLTDDDWADMFIDDDGCAQTPHHTI